MPRLSDTMEEGTILEWRKQVGDRVAVGDVLCEIETDKYAVELESEVAGTVAAITAEVGAVVPVGGAIAVVDA